MKVCLLEIKNVGENTIVFFISLQRLQSDSFLHVKTNVPGFISHVVDFESSACVSTNVFWDGKLVTSDPLDSSSRWQHKLKAMLPSFVTYGADPPATKSAYTLLVLYDAWCSWKP
ncbi:hypothetical protein DPMN_048209 [Dreissena polymorpha]|uniref:Uncharacterized protein n=1 Tax=Dreissena polymorpha TaxID=45954 RepID=A0A9D4DB55_DREPO|nr:hypothetical protein DPMN_048209 [Dreissena polymorpha]